jgi:hypothetical protein
LGLLFVAVAVAFARAKSLILFGRDIGAGRTWPLPKCIECNLAPVWSAPKTLDSLLDRSVLCRADCPAQVRKANRSSYLLGPTEPPVLLCSGLLRGGAPPSAV